MDAKLLIRSVVEACSSAVGVSGFIAVVERETLGAMSVSESETGSRGLLVSEFAML